MFKARILVELPKEETLRSKNPVEWVQSLFGKEIDTHTGEMHQVYETYSLVQRIYDALRIAGITDAVSFLIDKKVIYLDREEVKNDLKLLLASAIKSKVLKKPFKEMHFALGHSKKSLHTLVDIEIKNTVASGEDEMVIDFSARIEDLRIQERDSRGMFTKRVREFAKSPDQLENFRALLDELVEKLAGKVKLKLVGAKVRTEPAKVVIIRPEEKQIGLMRNLGWIKKANAPKYRTVPSRQKLGAYADPYYHYYYDPYYDLLNWILIDEMIHHQVFHLPYVEVVSPAGDLIGSGEDTAAISEGWAGDAIEFFNSGHFTISDSIPEVEADSAPGDYDGTDMGADFGGSDIDGSEYGGSDISGSDLGGGSWDSVDTGSSDSSSDFSSSSSCSSSSGSSGGSSCSSCGSSCGSSCS